MTTKASSTHGVQLQRGDGNVGGEVFTPLGEITNFNGPAESAAQIDVTSFDSPAREYIAGLKDGGDVTFDFNYIGSDVQQQGIRADLAAGTRRNFKLKLNDSAVTPTTIAFTAIVTKWAIQGGVDQAVKGSAALKVSGDPVYTYAI